MIRTIIANLTDQIWSFITGFLFMVVNYFYPVSEVVNLLLLLFLFDTTVGYWAARKLRGERFMVKIVWNVTVPRIFLTVLIIILLYLWDTIYKNEFISSYKIIAWFVSGLLIYSIAENATKITHWVVFDMIKKLMYKKIENGTGVSIYEVDKKTDEQKQ